MKQFQTGINLGKNELQNAVIQPLASAPSSPVEGQIYYNTTDQTIYVRKAGAWLDLGSQGAGNANLSAVLSATNTVINSSTGTGATVPAVDANNAGVMTPTMLTKLNGIQAGATVTDATSVDNAGAVMNTDTSVTAMQFVIAENNMASNSTTKIPTQASVKAYIDASVAGLLDFKGATDASTNPNYPAGSKGDTYVISVAGKVGGASGVSVEVGDMIVALADVAGGTQATVGASWTVLEHNLVGAVLASNNLSDLTDKPTAFANIKQNATTSATGVSQLATQAEAQAKANTVKAVTPASLADFARKYTTTIGNASATSFALTHGLGSQFVTVQVYDASTNEQIECDIVLTSATVATVSFSTAPASNAYRVVIVG